MGLIDRLMRIEAPKINQHSFMAALGEWERGKLTRAQVIAAFAVTADEEADLDALAGRIRPVRESYPIGGPATLGNVGVSYDATPLSSNLGFAVIETAGITALRLDVKAQKVGTGTQDWQLWDETATPPAEILVISDTGPAGLKTLTGTRTFSAPLAPGLRMVRVRAKSSVSTDDPVYGGACLIVERIELMTAEVLHEILLLASPKSTVSGARLPAYDTVEEVRARLRLP